MHTSVPRERIPADVSFAAHLQVRAGECALLGACPPHVVPRTLPGTVLSALYHAFRLSLLLSLLYPVYCKCISRPFMYGHEYRVVLEGCWLLCSPPCLPDERDSIAYSIQQPAAQLTLASAAAPHCIALHSIA